MAALGHANRGEISACPGIQNLRHQVEPLVLEGRGVIQDVGLHGASSMSLGPASGPPVACAQCAWHSDRSYSHSTQVLTEPPSGARYPEHLERGPNFGANSGGSLQASIER